MHLRLVQPVPSGAAAVAPLLLERVGAYGAGGDEQLALEALQVRIPIVVETGEPLGSPASGLHVRIAAERSAALFPVFAGTIEVAPHGMLSSALVLDGEYTVPLGLLGAVADRTVLNDVAQASLRRFLARLADDVAADVLRRESGLDPS